MNRITAALAGSMAAGSLALAGSASAAPPNNSTNFNIDISAHFGNESLHVELELHGNDPDGWPEDLWLQLHVENEGVACDEDGPIAFADDGDTIAIATGCLGDIEIEYTATRYRGHVNETGNQCKIRGVRDESADVSVPGVDVYASNVAWYQAVTEQCHSSGTPGNPQP